MSDDLLPPDPPQDAPPAGPDVPAPSAPDDPDLAQKKFKVFKFGDYGKKFQAARSVTPPPPPSQPADPPAVTPKGPTVEQFAALTAEQLKAAFPDPAAYKEARKAQAEARLSVQRHRRQSVIDLWVGGRSYRQVAELVGLSRETVSRYIHESHQTNAVSADIRRYRWSLRYQMGAGLAMSRLSAEGAQAPSHEEVAMLLASIAKVGSEDAKLWGDYAPVKVASTTPDGQSWAPLAVTFAQSLPTHLLEAAVSLQRMKLLPSAGETIEAEVVREKAHA